MNVNAINFNKGVALGTLGAIAGVHSGMYVSQKIAEKKAELGADTFETAQTIKKVNKDGLARTIATLASVALTVAFLKTPAGKKVIDKAKFLLEKFKGTKAGKAAQDVIKKVKTTAKPAVEKVEKLAHEEAKKLSQTKTANKIYDFGKNIVDKFKNSSFGQKAINGIKNLIAKFK